MIFDSSENDNDPSDCIFFFKTNRKIVFVRSVNYDLTKLLNLKHKAKTKKKKSFEKWFFLSNENFDIFEIDNIEKYLIPRLFKAKRKYFWFRYYRRYWQTRTIPHYQTGDKKIWNEYGDFLSPNQNIILRLFRMFMCSENNLLRSLSVLLIFSCNIDHSKSNASFRVFYGGFLQNIVFLFSK